MNSRRIYLVGFMGAGKSTVGKILADQLDCLLYDTDEEIEKTAGKSIPAIFDDEGEGAFREYETDVLEHLSKQDPPLVIATGGGLPLREENRQIMNNTGLPILLRVDAPTAVERVGEDANRPLFRDEQQVRNLLKQRQPVYREIETVIDTRDRSPEEIALEIIDQL